MKGKSMCDNSYVNFWLADIENNQEMKSSFPPQFLEIMFWNHYN